MKLLGRAIEGAQAAGAECELLHIYEKPFKGCVSCFACKIKNSKCNGLCAIKDDTITALLDLFLDYIHLRWF